MSNVVVFSLAGRVPQADVVGLLVDFDVTAVVIKDLGEVTNYEVGGRGFYRWINF